MEIKKTESFFQPIPDFEDNNFQFQMGEIEKDYDNNVYNTIIIENNRTKQIWMLENLKVTHYNDGTPIRDVKDDESWGTTDNIGKCCDYDNNPDNTDVYGKLYNWYVIKDSKICPHGWHVPTMDDWLTLKSMVGGIGGKLKSRLNWKEPNSGGTNDSFFTALPGGHRESRGQFQKLESEGVWWSSTKVGEQNARVFYLYYNLTCANIFSGGMLYGLSIRCIKDEII